MRVAFILKRWSHRSHTANCSDDAVFKREARDYSLTCLKKPLKQHALEHDLLYNPSSTKTKSNPISIITQFSNQHKSVQKIFEKYWPKMYPTIGPFVAATPAFTFRRAKSLKDKLVSSEFKGGCSKDPCKRPGTFRCGECNYCQFMNTSKSITLPNGEKYRSKHYANCRTIGVVYLLLCDCACFYVGKTMLEFWQRVYRHIVSMKTCNPSLPLVRHVTAIHDGVFPNISFVILDRIHPGI